MLSAVTQVACTPAANARSSSCLPSVGLGMHVAAGGTPASARRAGSVAHSRGRDSSRSSSTRPLRAAYARNTPIRQLAPLPPLPPYRRASPPALPPLFTHPLSPP